MCSEWTEQTTMYTPRQMLTSDTRGIYVRWVTVAEPTHASHGEPASRRVVVVQKHKQRAKSFYLGKVRFKWAFE